MICIHGINMVQIHINCLLSMTYLIKSFLASMLIIIPNVKRRIELIALSMAMTQTA